MSETVTVTQLADKVVVTEDGETTVVRVVAQGPSGPPGDTDLLAPVAFTGDYDDLTDKPTIPNVAGKADITYVNAQDAAVASSAQADLVVHTSRTDNPHSVTRGQIGLGSVDNTADLQKPISALTQAALDSKVDEEVGKGLSTNDYSDADEAKLAGIALGATQNASDGALRDRATHTGAQTISTVTGLQTALDAKATTTDLSTHTANTSNPHATTKAQVGLGSVDNTSDLSKPVSTPQAAVNATKVQIGGDLGGTVSAPIVNNRLKVIDVTLNGAVGNDSTDNTATLQAAIDSATAAGLPVYVPKGVFQSGRLLVPSGTVIIGADKNSSVIKRRAGTNNYLFQNADTSGGNSNITLSNFTVDGNFANQTVAPYHWLNWQNVSSYEISNLHVKNAGNARLRNASKGLIQGNYFESAMTTIDTVAISLEEGASFNRVIGNETYHYCNSVNINGPTVDTTGNLVSGNNFHDDGYFDGYIPTTRYGDAILVAGAMNHGNTITANTITKGLPPLELTRGVRGFRPRLRSG